MTTLVYYLNLVVGGIVKILSLPFRTLDPLWTLVVISVLSGIGAIWLFGKISNQEKIAAVKSKMKGNLLAVRLYQDDVGLMFRLQGRIMKYVGTYMGYNLFPMLVLLIPFVLLMIQLNLMFGHAPLPEGEKTLLVVRFDDSVDLEANKPELSFDGGVEIDAPVVRAPSVHEATWRLRATEPGQHTLKISMGDETMEKVIVIGDHWTLVPEKRVSSALELLAYPGEAPIPSESQFESIELKYASLPISVFGKVPSVLGYPIHWMIYLFVLSMGAGFALKGALGVEI